MPDILKNAETSSSTTPDVTLGAPTDVAPAVPAGAAAPAARPERSAADTARLLAEHFPALFGAGVIKPIKLRIQADIHQRAPGLFTRKELSFFLQRHTTGTAYLRALVAEGAARIDLDGQSVGEIAAEHRDAAGAELERRRAIVEAKKQAGREAARASRHVARPLPPTQPPRISPQAQASPSASQAHREQLAARGARAGQPGTAGRPDRSPTPSRPDQAPRRSRVPHPGVQRGIGRLDDAGSGAPRRTPQPLPERKPPRSYQHEPVNAPAVPLTPEQAAEAEARHQRAMLLRSFEESPLSKANFGALKGLSEEALDALLTLARQNRGSR